MEQFREFRVVCRESVLSATTEAPLVWSRYSRHYFERVPIEALKAAGRIDLIWLGRCVGTPGLITVQLPIDVAT